MTEGSNEYTTQEIAPTANNFTVLAVHGAKGDKMTTQHALALCGCYISSPKADPTRTGPDFTFCPKHAAVDRLIEALAGTEDALRFAAENLARYGFDASLVSGLAEHARRARALLDEIKETK